MTIKVVLADDHANVRHGLRNILSQSPEIEIVGEAKNGIEALERVKELNPDLLLLDIEMPGLKGHDVAQKMREAGSSARVLALSGYDEKHYIQRMFTSGAAGYLTKDEAPDQLIAAVEEVSSGQRGWISRSIAEKLGISTDQQTEDTKPVLTEEEIQILQLLACGKNDEEIASQLALRRATVTDHIKSLLSTLGLKSRLAGVIYAMRKEYV